MRHLFAVVPLALAAAAAAGEPLPTDPRLVTGSLENGLRYVVMQHATPPGRAAVWMHVDSGSLSETDAQRGLAHFLEHMAFNGSENFKPGAVVPFFESLGMTFGRDQNAFTNMKETTYQLSLPDNTPETLGKGLTFFADVNSRLLLLPEEIDAERGVILGEKTSRKSVQQRARDFFLERMAPGSLYSKRNTIGVDETLMAVQRQDFVDYYSRWYGPANTTVIVVADMAPAVVIEQITKHFHSPGPPKPVPADQDPGVKPYEASFAAVFSDRELTRASISIAHVRAPLPPTTTVELARDEWVGMLATRAFNRRMTNKVSEGKVRFQSAFVSAGNDPGVMRSITATASGEKERWKDILADLALEVQRARAFGLTDREIDESRRDALSDFEAAAAQESTLPARAFLARINGAIGDREPVMSAQQRLDLARRLLPGITTSECSAWFTSTFDPANAMFSAQIPEMPGVPTDEQLLALGLEAVKATPTPDADESRADSLMASLPEPGKVAESSVHVASNAWSAWLSNNVRVHHLFNDYHKNEVTVSISLLGGELFETAANRGITSAATIALGGGGGGRGGRGGGRAGGGAGGGAIATKSLSSADVRSLMTGKKIAVSGRAGADAIQLNISGDPADLEPGFQLAHLLLTQPRIEQVAFDRWRTQRLEMLDAVGKNPAMMFAKVSADTIYPDGEVRTRQPTRDQILSITLDAAQAHLEGLLASSPIEVAVVGDISRERATELVARYLGSLPTRARVTPGMFKELRTVAHPPGPRVARVELDTATEQALAMGAFFGPDRSNVHDVRAMTMARIIMTTRMVKRIREQEQLVYSISANFTPGSTYPTFGMFSAMAPTAPEKTEALAAAILDMFEDFAKAGPTEAELAQAKLQMANTLEEQMKEPSTWASRLETMTYDGQKLDDFLEAPAAYQRMTTDDIKDAYNRYYAKDRTVSIWVKPRGAN